MVTGEVIPSYVFAVVFVQGCGPMREEANRISLFRLFVVMGLLGVVSACGGGGSSSPPPPPPPPPTPSAVPLVAQPLVPDAAAPGGGGFTLTVNGSGFVSGSVVNWNGSTRTTHFVSSSQLTASITAADIATATTTAVTVVNPKPGGGASNTVYFPVAVPTASVTLNGSVSPASTGPRSVATGDFNGDGKLDLVVPNTVSGNVSILLGNGDGTFQPAVNYPAGQGSSYQFFQVAVADFNRDGKLDFVVSDYDGNKVSVFLGNGDGTFKPAVTYSAQTNPTSVTVADLRGDGNLDLIVSNQNCNSGPPCGNGAVSILLGNGDGTFQAHVDYDPSFTPPGGLPVGTNPNFVTVGDFNGDGKLDIAVAGGQGNCPGCNSAVSILKGKGDGTFQMQFAAWGLFTNPASIATADFNGDGKLDLVMVDDIGVFWVLMGNGDGTFQAPLEYITGSFPFGNIGIADFNGDGMLDLAIASSGLNDVEIFLGNGDGTFNSSPLHFPTGAFPQGVAVGDFNQNGRIDFAVPNYNDNTVSVLLQ